jgi:GAF domain-containing protein
MNRFWLALGMAGFLLGGFIGGWLTARFYRGQLESLHLEQARCSDAAKVLESKLALQNTQLEVLEQAARQRADAAERALALAREQAQSHEAAASRLLLERSDGEECAVVRRLIDRELLP